MPSSAVASGSCTEQTVTLSWMSGEDKENLLSLKFTRSEKEEHNETVVVFGLSELSVKLFKDAEHFPNASSPGFFEATVENVSLYETKLNNSYRCNSEDVVALTGDTKAFVHLSNLQMEAFRTQTDDKFSSAIDCAADGVVTSDIVPIAVGCALAALVVVVLIAYLIGRRRARQRGYQSV